MNTYSLFARGSVSLSTSGQMPLANDDTLDRKTDDPIFYIDIKSQELRDILRNMLRNINGVCLREDKPTV